MPLSLCRNAPTVALSSQQRKTTMDEFGEVLADLNVALARAVYLGEHDKMDVWHCTVTCPDKDDIVTEYRAGFGHRKPLVNKHLATGEQDWRNVPVKPTVADVVGALFVDASSVEGETFEGMCANFGLSTDSRKALDLYLVCQGVAVKLHKMFGASFARLAALAAER